MDKLIEALAPWPQLQGIAIGLVICAIGYWAIRKGREDKKSSESESRSIEDLKAQWEAYTHIDHIHENSFATVKHLERIVEIQLMILAATNRVADTRFNQHQ